MVLTLDQQYAAAVQDAEVYAGTWWALPANPMARERVDRTPGLARRLRTRAVRGHPISSAEVFRDASGWDGVRTDLHDATLNRLAPGSALAGLPPHAYFVLGVPGSGKTRTLRQIALRHAQSSMPPGSGLHVLLSDADAVRAALPEYAGGRGSAVLQDEVVVLTYGDAGYPATGALQERVGAARPGTAILVVDVVGDPRHLPGAVGALSGRGWEVYALLAECPLAICLDRVRQRAIDTGRIVSLDVVRAVGDRPKRALRAAIGAGQLTGWAQVDTSVAADQCTIVDTNAAAPFGTVGHRPLATP